MVEYRWGGGQSILHEVVQAPGVIEYLAVAMELEYLRAPQKRPGKDRWQHQTPVELLLNKSVGVPEREDKVGKWVGVLG